MKFYLARHAEAELGPPMDPTRPLTKTGEAQTALMSDFLKTQTNDIGLVVCSNMKRSIDTAEPIAEALGVSVVRDGFLDPTDDPMVAWRRIQKYAKQMPDKEILVVGHGPLVNRLVTLLVVSGDAANFHFSHASIAHLDTSTPEDYKRDSRYRTEAIAYMHWLVTMKLVNRLQEEDPKAIIESALDVADKLLVALGTQLDEATGEYYYDTEGVKRWVLGSGGQSGNCEECEENADEGWIPEDNEFPNAAEPPQHPNCDCTEEYKEKRVRVYV